LHLWEQHTLVVVLVTSSMICFSSYMPNCACLLVRAK
jgi:hypothetical protein